MKVITFSTKFPTKHPRAGEPTDFVRSIWEGLDMLNMMYDEIDPLLEEHAKSFYEKRTYTPKWHTIRAGNRWKEGDWFRANIWGDDINPKSGRSGPYQSKQINFASIQIKKVWTYETDICGVPSIDGFYLPEKIGEADAWELLAKNDGLSLDDFICWFNIHPKKNKEDKSFKGQIICWNEEINY